MQKDVSGSPRQDSTVSISGPHTASSSRSLLITLAVVLVADFMDLIDATMLSIAAPIIATDLQSSDAALQWMIVSYTLALGAALITGGRIGDQFGRRRVFLIGLAGSTLATVGSAFAPSMAVLIATRVLQGLATGLMLPQSLAIIRSSFEPEARAKAFGAYGAVLGLAAVAGPLLGGFLADANLFGLGWRAIFWVNVVIGAVTLIVGAWVLPESRAPGGTQFDLPGAGLAASVAVLVLLPLVQGSDWGWPWWSFVLLALSIPTAVAFIMRERHLVAHGGQPILNPVLLQVRAFSSGLLISLLFFGAIGAFFLLLSLYLQLGTGRTALDTSLIILPYAIGSLVTSGIGVQFATRAGRVLLVSGALMLAASQALLLFVVGEATNPSYWALAIPLFVGGLGIGLTAPVLVNVILAGVPAKDAGAASGVLTTVSQVGGAVGVAVLGLLFFNVLNASFAAAASPLAAYSAAFSAILPWQIACYGVAAALMLLLPRRAISDAPQE
ncbi:MAG: MFS transporter [Roseiflexaceae bacterium]|nr:MFS transporter [Roseiflexaceae bacterium]